VGTVGTVGTDVALWARERSSGAQAWLHGLL